MYRIFLPLMISILTLSSLMEIKWTTDIDNKRPYMIQNESLMEAAKWKAHILNEQFDGVIQHCVNGECPNATVERFGCVTGFDGRKNYVESLVSGTIDINIAYEALKNSPSHRPHILGEGFFNNQIFYGVAQEGFIYVFLSAFCLDKKEQSRLLKIN